MLEMVRHALAGEGVSTEPERALITDFVARSHALVRERENGETSACSLHDVKRFILLLLWFRISVLVVVVAVVAAIFTSRQTRVIESVTAFCSL